MNIIKVNYNNAFVKQYKKLMPSFYAYAFPFENGQQKILLGIENNLGQEEYFDDYKFEIYIANTLVAYATKSEGYDIEIDLTTFENDISLENTLSIVIKGYYTKDGKKLYEFGQSENFIELTLMCDDLFTCSEDLYADD